MKKKEQPVIYYTDELNDEFAGDSLKARKIDENYSYDGNPIIRAIARFFWYRIIFLPGAALYLKFCYHHKIVNKKVIKAAKNKPVFLFGNHTHAMADPYIPTLVVFPKSNYVIVHANNVSIPVLGKINPCLGAIPLPDNIAATRNFLKCIENKIQKNRSVTIYPEAHIWPYYTKIRPFVDSSFRYPVQYNTPVFCFTNTYQKKLFSKKPKIVTYIDGPFYPDQSLSAKEQRTKLRNQVYEAMVERSKLNTVELIKYIKKENTQND
jgi:1-acyl-sn-glycerol-3-phosphate acyltransferase